MPLKPLLRDLTPPLLVEPLRRIRDVALRRPRKVKWEYSPAGWVEPVPGTSTWNEPVLLDAHRRAWDAWVEGVSGPEPLGVDYFRSLRGFEDEEEGKISRRMAWAHNGVMAYAYSLALAARMKQRLTIFDWGGGVGQFERVAAALLPEVEIEYHSRDVPALSALGAELNPVVTFYADDEAWLGRRFDFVTSISAFHFERDWQSLLTKLASVTDGYFLLSRVPTVSKSPSFVFVQRSAAHDMPIEFCGWFLNREELLDHATKEGLRLRREFLIMDETPAERVPEQAQYLGFLFESR
jgi:putative methyltransferase (TIGR04325 family)